jgi:hypothetical protein
MKGDSKIDSGDTIIVRKASGKGFKLDGLGPGV